MKNNYYNEIKNKLIDNEVYKKVKDYSKNRNDLSTYYEVGKLLYEAGNKYGEGIIKKYSERLVIEVGKKYNKRTLFRMRQFYNMIEIQKVSPVATQLTWSHYCELLPLKDINEINYYVKITIEQCQKKYVLCDHSKFGEVSSVTFLAFTGADVITDRIAEGYQDCGNIVVIE